jgi:hypothetical protein
MSLTSTLLLRNGLKKVAIATHFIGMNAISFLHSKRYKSSRGLLVELSATRALCSHFIFSNFKNFLTIIFILFYENGSEKNESIMNIYYFKFKQNYYYSFHTTMKRIMVLKKSKVNL